MPSDKQNRSSTTPQRFWLKKNTRVFCNNPNLLKIRGNLQKFLSENEKIWCVRAIEGEIISLKVMRCKPINPSRQPKVKPKSRWGALLKVLCSKKSFLSKFFNILVFYFATNTKIQDNALRV